MSRIPFSTEHAPTSIGELSDVSIEDATEGSVLFKSSGDVTAGSLLKVVTTAPTKVEAKGATFETTIVSAESIVSGGGTFTGEIVLDQESTDSHAFLSVTKAGTTFMDVDTNGHFTFHRNLILNDPSEIRGYKFTNPFYAMTDRKSVV